MSSSAIKAAAVQLGFDLVGIAPAVTPTGVHDFLSWLNHGYAGDMTYLERREAAYEHPRHVLDGVKSVIMLGLNYNTQSSRHTPCAVADGTRSVPATMTGRVSRYATGLRDYHDVIREKLAQLAESIQQLHPGCKTRGVVDTAPLLERDFARLAGLGWFGKNTMLINKRMGSWFFLAGMLVDIELEYDAPHAASHCGTCTRCLDACPTDAFVGPYVLDARKCISYLTIEHRGPIAEELRGGMGDWIFGCDICQEVCPWNRKAPLTDEPAFQPRPDLAALDPVELLSLSNEDFRLRFRDTPLARPKRAGVLRNAAIALGNARDQRAIPALTGALGDDESLVRDAAAWALGQIRRENSEAPTFNET